MEGLQIMRNFLVLVVFLLSLTAQSQIRAFAKVSEVSPASWVVNVYGEQAISENISFSYFVFSAKAWAEALGGLTYRINDNVSASMLGGVEQHPEVWRLASSLFCVKGKWALFAWVEKGGGEGNYWYNTCLTRQVCPFLTAGIMSSRFNVTGPYLETPIRKNVSLWTNFGRDLEFKENRILIGTKITL